LSVLELREHEKFPNVFRVTVSGQSRLATRNLAASVSVYGEELVHVDGAEYRIWDPYRSKLAAAINKGLTELPITLGRKVLYLGAASGTTVSHISDILGNPGEIYAVEFSQRSMRDLIERVCRYRTNVHPILADARIPIQYRLIVNLVDTIYCDVAQPEQAKILVRNSEMFLRQNGRVMFSVKSRSIDVTLRPVEVFDKEIEVLKKSGFQVLQAIRLEPYDKDHAMITAIFRK